MKYLSILLSIIVVASCDPYSGFGAICSEGHPAVAHARSFSEDQLAFLYTEMFRLRVENTDTRIEYSQIRENIPVNLLFLKAVWISPNNGLNPNIMLAGCMDEFVNLNFFGPDDEFPRDDNPQVVLTWAPGTVESPNNTESQILWEMEK